MLSLLNVLIIPFLTTYDITLPFPSPTHRKSSCSSTVLLDDEEGTCCVRQMAQVQGPLPRRISCLWMSFFPIDRKDI